MHSDGLYQLSAGTLRVTLNSLLPCMQLACTRFLHLLWLVGCYMGMTGCELEHASVQSVA